MSKSTRKLQFVLIQVRELPEVALHEQQCFMERCSIDREDMRVINVVESPRVTWDDVAGGDVVILGGAAAHSVTEDYEFTEPLAEVSKRLIEEGVPVFGSCWGHQFLARILGGEVVTDPAREEVGSFEIHVTPEGLADPVFEGFPRSFLAHMGHHDSVTRLPEGAVELAYSDRCRNQVYRLAGRMVYGTQFHAEMSGERLIERLSYYRDTYLPSDEEFESLKSNPLPTPEADRILVRFLEMIG